MSGKRAKLARRLAKRKYMSRAAKGLIAPPLSAEMLDTQLKQIEQEMKYRLSNLSESERGAVRKTLDEYKQKSTR